MQTGLIFYGFTRLRKTFLNRGVGFYAFTHLQAASYVCVCVCRCACVCVHACVCGRRVNA